ncbi:MAG: phosphoribosylanthranilate isomerase [Terriglobales bacterium]|jgi:phosphoribosylanthranilate isomerase
MTWIKICGITNLDDALAATDAGANAIGFVFYPKSLRYITPEAAQFIAQRLPAHVQKVGVFVNHSIEEVRDAAKLIGLNAVQLHGHEDRQFAVSLFRALANGAQANGARTNGVLASVAASANGTTRPTIYRSFAAQIFDKPAEEPVGWDPVAVGLIEPDEAFRGKRVHKIHVAKDGDLFLETHGFRPGVISGVLLDSSTACKPGGTGEPFDWERVQPWAGVINSISKLIVAGGLYPGNVQDAIHVLHPWGVDVSSGVESEPGKKDARKVRAFIQAVRAMEKSKN